MNFVEIADQMKNLIILIFILVIGGSKVLGQVSLANKYLDTAQAYLKTGKAYQKALDYYELSIKAGNKGNYTYYYASQAACKTGNIEKSIRYGKLSFAEFQDFYNYEFFANDTLNSCFNQSEEGRLIITGLKIKYVEWKEEEKSYLAGVNDKTKRINESALSDSIKLSASFKSKSAKDLETIIKNFKAFPKPVVKDHWTLYTIKARDTINMPFLIYVPKNYDPKKKHFLYVYLHGAAGNRKQFSINSQIPKWEKEVLKKPLLENAIILYAFARKDINWINNQDAFSAIEKEIVYTKSLYNIDDNRVYVGGHSDGGRGAFCFAINKPTVFAAMYGVCYYPSSYLGNTSLGNLRNEYKFYGISGADDELFPASRVNPVWEFAKANGANWENFTLKGTHGLPIDNPDSTFFVYDRFLKDIRNPFPKKIQWETDDVRNGRNTWIEIMGIDTLTEKADWQVELNPPITQNGKIGKANFTKNKSGAVIASAEGNTINISTSRVKKIRLYISPDMFDLNQHLKIRVNNKDFINIKLEANKKVMMEEFIRTKDRSFLVAQIVDLTVS